LSITKDEMIKLLELHNGNNKKCIEEIGVSETTWFKYKRKFGLTKVSAPVSLKDKIFSIVSDGILNVKKFSKENNVSIEDIYLTIEDIEEDGFIVEKGLSGFYINKAPSADNLIHQYTCGNHIKFGYVTDVHLCSRFQQLTYLHALYDIFEGDKINLVMNSGDLGDGEDVYFGHKNEIFIHGVDAQVEYIAEKYPKRNKIKTKMISGNHDLSVYKRAGCDIVKQVSKIRNDIEYLGMWSAYVDFNNNLGKKVRVQLLHPDKGGAYALSYKAQKIVEGYSSDNKPNVLLLGHWHTSLYFFRRNVHVIQGGALQSQTPYLLRKGIEPEIGGWIIDLHISDDGSVNRCNQEFISFFNPIYRDYGY